MMLLPVITPMIVHCVNRKQHHVLSCDYKWVSQNKMHPNLFVPYLINCNFAMGSGYTCSLFVSSKYFMD